MSSKSNIQDALKYFNIPQHRSVVKPSGRALLREQCEKHGLPVPVWLQTKEVAKAMTLAGGGLESKVFDIMHTKRRN